VKVLLAADQDFPAIAGRDGAAGAARGRDDRGLGRREGRADARLGHRSGHDPRTLVTRAGKLELRVPQDRHGRFSTELFARYQRSARALVAALAGMYVQGVSTRKVKAITEALCGHGFSAAAIRALNLKLDEELARFAQRRLDEACPSLIVDARYERGA
jgi:putative transposase